MNISAVSCRARGTVLSGESIHVKNCLTVSASMDEAVGEGAVIGAVIGAMMVQ